MYIHDDIKLVEYHLINDTTPYGYLVGVRSTPVYRIVNLKGVWNYNTYMFINECYVVKHIIKVVYILKQYLDSKYVN